MNDTTNRARRAHKYFAVLLAFAAALLLASCPPEAQQSAEPQQSSITPVISYCGIEGIAELTLAIGTTHGALSANTAVSWSSADDSIASVAADGAITLNSATVAGTPAVITATSGGKTARLELKVLTANGVVDIEDETDLRAIAFGLDGSYKLANDITLTKEWTPIGTGPAPFAGTLDGAGFTIQNLFIEKPTTARVGLVGVNAAGGVIKDLGVEVGAAGIVGNVKSGSVGALVGYNFGTVSGVATGGGGD